MDIVISSGTKKALYGLPVPHKRKMIYTKIMELVYGKICREQCTLDEFLEIPRNYWRACGVRDPHKYLKQLEDFNIIEIDHHYFFNEYKSKSKGYRITPDLAFTSPMLLKFHNKATKQHNRKDPLIKQTIKNLQRLKTTYRNQDAMLEITQRDINFEYLKKDGLQVCKVPEGKYFLYQYNEEKRQNEKVKDYPLPRKNIIGIAYDQNKKTIFWKNKVYLTDNATEWINKKIIEIQHHYLHSLNTMRYIKNAKNIICSRNEINYRLDTNITSSPSKMLQYIRSSKNESPMSFDINNSQLAFFGAGVYHLERIFNFFEIKKMFAGEKCAIFNTSPYLSNLNNDYSITILNKSIEHITTLKDKEIIKNNKKRKEKYKSFNTRGISDTVFTSSPMIARVIACQKWVNFRGLDEFRKLCAGGRIYEYFASKLYDSRYKGVFSDCQSFEQLERKVKYSQSIKNDQGQNIGGVVKLHYNLSTFGKTHEQYKRELKAIRNDVKRLTFQTIFPHYSQSNDLKKMLKKDHPAVIDFIDNFKKEFASPNFSNFLSRLESAVFIDGIYAECLERGLEVHPKHDGIIFFPSERVRVMGVITKHLNEFFTKGKYKYDIEDIVEKYKS